jgi:two-component system sensor histidine kinase RegB
MLLLVNMALGRQMRLSPWVMLALLIFEVGAVNIVIAINGAVRNAYNVILLIPLVLAFMLLPLIHAGILLVVSISSQASQLFVLASHTHHDMQMLQHFRAMVGSFIVVNLLVAAVVFYFRFQLARRELAIQNLRERQLRDEQLLAIGTAAAQFSHDVATPTQSIRLLLEEILEQQPKSEAVLALNQQFERIEQHLRNWRDVADDVREQRTHAYNVSSLWRSLKQLLSVARPESSINWCTGGLYSCRQNLTPCPYQCHNQCL